jgi:hypothetical protein
MKLRSGYLLARMRRGREAAWERGDGHGLALEILRLLSARLPPPACVAPGERYGVPDSGIAHAVRCHRKPLSAANQGVLASSQVKVLWPDEVGFGEV